MSGDSADSVRHFRVLGGGAGGGAGTQKKKIIRFHMILYLNQSFKFTIINII